MGDNIFEASEQFNCFSNNSRKHICCYRLEITCGYIAKRHKSRGLASAERLEKKENFANRERKFRKQKELLTYDVRFHVQHVL